MTIIENGEPFQLSVELLKNTKQQWLHVNISTDVSP